MIRPRLRAPLSFGSGFESTRFLAKWLPLSTAIGVVAGLGAILFTWAIHAATQVFLGDLVGYLPPGPVGEGQPVVTAMARPWLLPLVTALGATIGGIVVFWLAPEAEGHGTDAAIAAIHHKGARIRARVPPIKLFASALTIGSGDSAGREGPAAQISAGFGSLLGDWFNLSPRDRRIAVAAGIGAGIGAIFRAPLGGAVLAAEIQYLHDIEVEPIIPSLIASIVGYTIYSSVYGFEPIFGNQSTLGLESPIQLLYYALLGVLCGLVGIVYAKSFYGIEHLFRRLRIPRWVKPAIGGLLVGLIGIAVPASIHTGYGWLQIGMTDEVLTMPLWILLALPFLKILATSLSIGSGGSGGIFGPGMVIGGFVGAAFWRLSQGLLPAVPAQPAAFVIIAMMALFGSVAHAPLAMMLMVAEMTGNLSLLAPAMIAVGTATALVGDVTIYKSQLTSRAEAPAHRIRFSFPLLASLLVRDAVHPAPLVLPFTASVAEAKRAMSETGAEHAVVLQGEKPIGILTWADVARVPLDERKSMDVHQMPLQPVNGINPQKTLEEGLEALADAGVDWLPVVEGDALLGAITNRDVVATYKRFLQRGVRRARSLDAATTLEEHAIPKESKLANQTIASINFPPDTLVVSVRRDSEIIFPRGDTVLKAGDILMIAAGPNADAALRRFFLRSERPGGTGRIIIKPAAHPK